jgi:hypothetical protein
VVVAAGGIVSRAFGFGVNEVLDGIGEWVGNGAAEMLKLLGHVLDASTRPELDQHWFLEHFQNMASLAALLILPMLLVSIMQSIVRQDLSLLLRSALVHLPLALLLTAVAVELVQLSLAAVDAMCTYVSKPSGGDVQAVVSSVSGALLRTSAALGQPGAATFVLFLGGLVVAVAAMLLWLELVVRTAAIYVAVLFLPLAMATLVWPAVSHWCRRLAETLAALVLSKLVVVAILSLAAGALAGNGGSADLSGVISGAALLLLAAFSPFTLLRLVPAVEAGAMMHLEGVSRRASSLAVESGSALPWPSLPARSGSDDALTVSVGDVEGEPGLGSTFATGAAVAATGGAAAAGSATVGGAAGTAGAGGTAAEAGVAGATPGPAGSPLALPLPPPRERGEASPGGRPDSGGSGPGGRPESGDPGDGR